MIQRQLRPDQPKAVRKSVSMTEGLAEATAEQARREGHNNFSAVIVRALIEYLNRQNDVRAA